MFSSTNPVIMIFGVILALVFIIGSVWWVNKLFKTNNKGNLVRFVILIFTSLVTIFIVDKTLAFNQHILTGEESKDLFDLIENLTLMIFSYYFGTKTSNKNDDVSED